MSKCSNCGGKGEVLIHGDWRKCESCNGTGQKIEYGTPRCSYCDVKMKYLRNEGIWHYFECPECGTTKSQHEKYL